MRRAITGAATRAAGSCVSVQGGLFITLQNLTTHSAFVIGWKKGFRDNYGFTRALGKYLFNSNSLRIFESFSADKFWILSPRARSDRYSMISD